MCVFTLVCVVGITSNTTHIHHKQSETCDREYILIKNHTIQPKQPLRAASTWNAGTHTVSVNI